MVDEAKHQSGHFSCKDHHDDQKEKAEAEFRLAKRGAASHQAEDEHHHADADNDRCWDQRLLVLNETAKVVIALDHVGTNVGQCSSCSPENQAEEEQDGLGRDDSAVHGVWRGWRETVETLRPVFI